jgi:hypothetical protein
VQAAIAFQRNTLNTSNSFSEQVREGAVSAIATIIECCRNMGCPEHIAEISPNIAQFLGMCLQSYHGRNLLIALDATEQLAMSCNLAASASVSG